MKVLEFIKELSMLGFHLDRTDMIWKKSVDGNIAGISDAAVVALTRDHGDVVHRKILKFFRDGALSCMIRTNDTSPTTSEIRIIAVMPK